MKRNLKICRAVVTFFPPKVLSFSNQVVGQNSGSFFHNHWNISSWFQLLLWLAMGMIWHLFWLDAECQVEAIFGLIKLLTQTDRFSLFCVNFISRSRTFSGVLRRNTDRRCGKLLENIPLTFCQTRLEKMFRRKLGKSTIRNFLEGGCYSFSGAKIEPFGTGNRVKLKSTFLTGIEIIIESLGISPKCFIH